ncbi:recombinase family protein [Solirubrobacter phytolaccae]|uniref:Recombinase family protein n=1 Tax=Solirubrobacter phytolaccae TaxID=1404360 RepID=A0A9X3N668_9ACTN|nr:recombinase family protein [Solirubrobacter phytolaccae]MDA0179019.1 recombinase family protein [Solirubrobacter phytolaccae]
MSAPTIPVVIYAARSKAEEPGKDSTGDQVKDVRARLESDQERFECAGPFIDHASGSKGDRGPDLRRAIEAAESAAARHGRAELWASISSRFARGSGKPGEARALGKLFYDLRAVGVTLRTVEDDEFITNEMLIGFASKQASKYADDLSANVRRGIRHRDPTKGPWGVPAYGFRKRDDGHWEPDPVEAPVARRMFDIYLQTSAYNAVLAALTLDGVRPRRGSMWTVALIRKVITGRSVLGYFRRGDDWVRGEHPAIVEEAIWEAAQRIAENSRKWTPKGGGRLPARHVFVRGMLVCDICGQAFLPRTERNGRETYQCKTAKQVGKKGCQMPILRRAEVEVPALRLFERWALDVDGTRERLAEQLAGREGTAREQAARAAREAADAASALDRFDRDYASGALDAADYGRLTAKFRDELSAADAERDRLHARADEVAAMLGGLDAEHEGLRRLAELRAAIAGQIGSAGDDVQALRAAMAAVFEKVHVVPEQLYEDQIERAEQPRGFAPGLAAGLEGDLLVVPAVRLDMIADPLEAGEADAFLRRVALAFGPLQRQPDNQHLTLVS